tara:strand:+ start:675 stop:1130 length:456 start_codon:yes stop_codon:yes gene_type:complete
MIRKIKSSKLGPVRANKVTYDGIQFLSGLECYMYKSLKKNNIAAKYEGKSYTLLPSFVFNHESYERQTNGKGDMINRGNKKIQPIKYTPDFVGDGFIIECKGRANESFPIRWKLFKKYVIENLEGVVLYKPQNQKECELVVNLIKENKNEK